MADSKVSALSEISVPDFSDDLYLVDNTGPTSYKVGTDRMGGLLTPGVCQGRLTLTTGTPITTSDVSSAGTLYFTPYLGNRIGLYDGTRWLLKTFSETSLALTLTAAKAYDVFIDDDASTLSLSAAWTDDTTRANALTTQDGVPVLGSDTTKRWLGTIYASGTNTTEDAITKRYVWNAYNRVPRNFFISVAGDHEYTTATFREWNGGTGSVRAQWIQGDSGMLDISLETYLYGTGSAFMQMGVDSTSSASGLGIGTAANLSPGSQQHHGRLTTMMTLGKHFIAPLEYGGTGTRLFNYQMTGWILG